MADETKNSPAPETQKTRTLNVPVRPVGENGPEIVNPDELDGQEVETNTGICGAGC